MQFYQHVQPLLPTFNPLDWCTMNNMNILVAELINQFQLILFWPQERFLNLYWGQVTQKPRFREREVTGKTLETF